MAQRRFATYQCGSRYYFAEGESPPESCPTEGCPAEMDGVTEI